MLANAHPPTMRPAQQIMTLAHIGTLYPTRLSFMRQLIRRLHTAHVSVNKNHWHIDKEGLGDAVYSVELEGNHYSLIVFSVYITPDQRTDRVIAEQWDITFVLYDGIPNQAEIERLRAQVPLQEKGRYSEKELVLSRANKSVRLFEHVVSSLAAGKQPDIDKISSIGYLMRTTAVYGNGKFGIADRAQYKNRPALKAPFQVEMLAVWLVRSFTHDLVEYIAHQRSPKTAVGLQDSYRCWLGIGNSTGLGMAPFLVRHPILLNNWVLAKETALSRICQLPQCTATDYKRILTLFNRAIIHVNQWNVDDTQQMQRIMQLREELPQLYSWYCDNNHKTDYLQKKLFEQSQKYSKECEELIISLLIESHPVLIDDLEITMVSDDLYSIDPAMLLDDLQSHIHRHCAWALNFDFSTQTATEKFWYVSEEKLEPRIGNRYRESGSEKEMPVDIARQIQRLNTTLAQQKDKTQTVADFLSRYPEYRYCIARVQNIVKYPFAEIQDNLVGQHCLPIDLLRCKLSFFGATKFDPKSDRWTRVNLFQGAPTINTINHKNADDWWLPQNPLL